MDGVEPDITTDELAALLRQLTSENEERELEGFTTREYCLATGNDSNPDSRGYRRALNELRKHKADGLIRPARIKRQDIMDDWVSVRGWTIVRE